jgi:hypothetical protein
VALWQFESGVLHETALRLPWVDPSWQHINVHDGLVGGRPPRCRVGMSLGFIDGAKGEERSIIRHAVIEAVAIIRGASANPAAAARHVRK